MERTLRIYEDEELVGKEVAVPSSAGTDESFREHVEARNEDGRNDWFGVITTYKALGALLVIVIHITANLTRLEGYIGFLGRLANTIALPAVPLFIFASGFSLSLSYAERPLRVSSFYGMRLLKIVFPYLLWSAVYSGITRYYEYLPFDWEIYWNQLWNGNASFHLYFVLIILQLYLLFPLLFRFVSKYSMKIVLPAAIFFSVGGTMLYYLTVDLPLVMDRLFIPYLHYFVFGMYVAKDPVRFMGLFCRAKFFLFSFYGIGAFLIFTDFISVFSGTLLLYTVFYVTGFLLVLIFAQRIYECQNKVSALMYEFGRASYYVYLSHPVVFLLLERILVSTFKVGIVLRPVIYFFVILVGIIPASVMYVRLKNGENRKKRRWRMALFATLCIILGSSFAFASNRYYFRYHNAYAGYSLMIRTNLKFDDTAIEHRARFYDDETTIDIFYDDFRGKLDNYATYTVYSDLDLLKNKRFEIEKSLVVPVDGTLSNLVMYRREKIDQIQDDKNHYAILTIPRTSEEVVTVFVKSSKNASEISFLLNSFRWEEKTRETPYTSVLSPFLKNLSQNAQSFLETHLAERSPQRFGIYSPISNTVDSLETMEKNLDYSFDVVLTYRTPLSEPEYDMLRKAAKSGKAVEYTMQTTLMNEHGYAREDMTFDILAGKYDDALLKHIRAIKESGAVVLFRLNNEMNGEWCLYSAYYHGKDTDIYIALYRYIHDLFRKNGADNVLFVFNPNERSFPYYSWNHAYCYYPGDEYVDIVGMTGYNTGTYYPGEQWRSFAEIYDPLYSEYSRKFRHSLMVTEFSCSSIGGDKMSWIQDMFDRVPDYPRVKCWVWWSGTDYEVKTGKNSEKVFVPSRIYRLDESPEMIDLFRKNLQKFK